MFFEKWTNAYYTVSCFVFFLFVFAFKYTLFLFCFVHLLRVWFSSTCVNLLCFVYLFWFQFGLLNAVALFFSLFTSKYRFSTVLYLYLFCFVFSTILTWQQRVSSLFDLRFFCLNGCEHFEVFCFVLELLVEMEVWTKFLTSLFYHQIAQYFTEKIF